MYVEVDQQEPLMIRAEELDQQMTCSLQLHVEKASDQIVYSTAKTSNKPVLVNSLDLLQLNQKIIRLQN